MIITLKGTVTVKKAAYAVIDVGGIGHQVFLNKDGLRALTTGAMTSLWTYEHVREDARELYGFLSEREHGLFLELLDVSGVGPRMALNILSLGPADTIAKHIEEGDADWISRVPGVGKKTAQKIILELKGKLVGIEDTDPQEEEVLSALTNLGYPRERAREAVARSSGESASVEDRLRGALRVLGRKL